MDMHEDLRWLAENVAEWPKGCERIALDPDGEVRFSGVGIGDDFYPERPLRGAVKVPAFVHSKNQGYLKAQWQAARQQLEDERINNIARNGNDGDHYATPEEDEEWQAMEERQDQSRSDGSTASYYRLPEGCTELQHLISHRNMNAQIGEIFRACYRYGMASHSDQMRDAKKVLFYAMAEVERLEKLEAKQ